MHKLHHLMTMLVFAKMISLFFEAAMFHYIQTTGHSTGACERACVDRGTRQGLGGFELSQLQILFPAFPSPAAST